MMNESFSEGRSEAANILRLCMRRADRIDITNNLVAGVLRQSIGRILAKGYLNDLRVQTMAETTLAEVQAMLVKLEAMERSSHHRYERRYASIWCNGCVSEKKVE